MVNDGIEIADGSEDEPEGTTSATTENENEETETSETSENPELAKIREALKKANAEAKASRLELKKLKQTHETDNEKALREARETAVTEVEGKYKVKLVHAEAKSLLTQAGLSTNVERALKLIDMDLVTLNDDGSTDGLNEQIKSLKADMPELFKTRNYNGSIDAGTRPAGAKQLSTAEQIARQVIGN